MRYSKNRKGFSLVELLIAIVVLGILGAITITAGSSAQRRARVTSAMTVFDNYKNAYNTAIMDHAGLVNDREDTWAAAGGATAYSSQKAFERLVANMNRALQEELQLVWNTNGYWESKGNDPWGGKYVLLECPSDPSGVDYWDMGTVTDGRADPPVQNKACLRCSIWCTGIDEYIAKPDAGLVTVRDISIGIVMKDEAGAISYQTHGAQDGALPFTDYVIHVQ